MNPFRLPSELRSVVCIGAHPDDIEIGAGATIALLSSTFPAAAFKFVILTASEKRKDEAIASATSLLGRQVDVTIGSFNDGFLPYDEPGEVKRFLRSSLPTGSVDLVLTPQLGDRHQDHRYLGELTTQLFRDNSILSYEVAKYDGGLVPPNVYIHVTEERAKEKVAHLRRSFPSQADHHWFTDDAFLGLMRIRGNESQAPEGFAEAFVSSKVVFG
jgi:LmbE family N-acetylglucosaminyl deacetylase